LAVLPVRPTIARIKGKLMGTIMDNKPIVNIKPFGQCQSLANPTVAAATAACNGKLQKMPCIPNTTTPWIGGKMRVQICGEPTILENSKLMCMWAGMIEITNPGQDLVVDNGAISLRSKPSSVKVEKRAKEIEVVAGDAVEAEEKAELTVKDIAEILKKIEGKQGYEAARYYATNNIDYWKVNLLAQKYAKADNDEIKEKEKDNDPNLMPSRFMLLYGADDDELRSLGNMDDHPDKFDDQEEEHKISVEMLRLGLQVLGYNVNDAGPFDDALYHAFLQYHWQRGRVNLGGIYEDENDPKRPLDRVADRYGVSTWKYFHEKYGGEIDHERIMEELNTEYGDKLLTEKGVDPHTYKPGVSYHYVWVPLNATGELDGEYKGKEVG
jgi:hypothetical protein